MAKEHCLLRNIYYAVPGLPLLFELVSHFTTSSQMLILSFYLLVRNLNAISYLVFCRPATL